MKGKAALFIGFTVILFMWGAERQSRFVNTNMHSRDQSAYMNYAKKLRQTNYKFIGGRNRMPVYPFLMSLFYREKMSDKDFFELGKRVNVVVAIVVLAVVFLIFRIYVSPFDALTATLVTAFTLFVYKAPYFQTELLFYGLNFGLFVLLLELVTLPRLRIAAAVGIVAAVAHLTKASVLPALVLGLVCLIPHIVSPIWQAILKKKITTDVVQNKNQNNAYRSLASFFVVVVIFITIIFPYIRTSKAIFGQYFYNVNSTFYIWYDSWDEVKRGTRAHGDRVGWPDMPEDQIPSMRKYLRDHTAQHILGRFAKGGHYLLKNIMFYSYGFTTFILLYITFLSALVWQHRRRVLPVFLNRRYLTLFFFIYGYFIGYFMLYAWYSQIAGGFRFMLALFLPLMFLLARLLSYAQSENLSAQIFGKAIHSKLLNRLVLLFLFIYLATVFPAQLRFTLGGN